MPLAARLANFSPTQDYVPHRSQFDSPLVLANGGRGGVSVVGGGGGGGSSSSSSHIDDEHDNDRYFRGLSRSPDITTRIVLLVDTREQHQSNHQYFWSRVG